MGIHKSIKIITIATLILTSISTCVGARIQSLQTLDIALCILGLLATTYVVYFAAFFFIDKIKRDVILIKKNYWIWVILLVVAVPFVFARIMLLMGMPYALLADEANRYNIIVAEGQAQGLSVLWSAFFHYLDSGNQHITGEGGRLMSAIMSVCGILLFNGLLVSTMLSWTARRKEQWDNGYIRYPLSSLPKNRYAVVIGANEVVVPVIKDILKPYCRDERLDYLHLQDNDYVVLLTSSPIAQVREQLSAQLTDDELNRVICYNGMRNSQKEMEQLHLPYASCIYILGESTTGIHAETGHDALNMHCMNLIAHQLKDYMHKMGDKYVKKQCRVMFDYHTTHSVFQFSDIASIVRETMAFIPFNLYESWARKVLVDNKAVNQGHTIHYTPLDGYEGIRATDDKRVHLVIVGMSKMGVALAEQTLYHAHYMNADKQRTRITFIDAEADKKMAFFKGCHATLMELMRHRYVDSYANIHAPCFDPMQDTDSKWKHLSEDGKSFIDTEVEFVKGQVESDVVRSYLCELAADVQSKVTIAVCLNHTNQSLAASLYLPIEVYESAQVQDIWVYQRDVQDMVSNLTDQAVSTSSIRYKKLRPFGMLHEEEMGTQTAYLKAILVNTAYSATHDHSWPVDMGDKNDPGRRYAQEAWEQLLVTKKWSNYFFVHSMYQKMRGACAQPSWAQPIIGAYNDPMYAHKNWQQEMEQAIEHNLQAMAVAEHNRWNMEQLLMGYSPCKKAEDDRLQALVQENNQEEQARTKQTLKLSAAKVHPNICDYKHLSLIDPAAKDYDTLLIRAIPRILMLVDGYGMCQYKNPETI